MNVIIINEFGVCVEEKWESFGKSEVIEYLGYEDEDDVYELIEKKFTDSSMIEIVNEDEEFKIFICKTS